MYVCMDEFLQNPIKRTQNIPYFSHNVCYSAGWDTISKLHDMFKADPMLRSSAFLIIPLHSMMPTAFQQSVSLAPQCLASPILASSLPATGL